MNKNERASGAKRERLCAVTKIVKPDFELIRFVANEAGEVFPDIHARAPGRGIWISSDAKILEQGIKQNTFSRSFKTKLDPKPELIEITKKALYNNCLNLLGIAKRSAQFIFGFDNVENHLRNKASAFLIEASDGAIDGRNKILSLAKRWPNIEIISCFNGTEIGGIMGRDNIIHAIIPDGQFANNWRREINRLKGFMEIGPLEIEGV